MTKYVRLLIVPGAALNSSLYAIIVGPPMTSFLMWPRNFFPFLLCLSKYHYSLTSVFDIRLFHEATALRLEAVDLPCQLILPQIISSPPYITKHIFPTKLPD